MNGEEFRHWSHKAADWGADYRETLRERPVRAQTKPGDIARQIADAAPETGEVLIPFTRVLSVVADDAEGPWRKVLGAESCVRVERLVWVEGDSPAFSQFHIAMEHGRHLLDEPIEQLHGVSFHRILGRR